MSADDMLLTTAKAQGDAIGVSRWTIQAVRKAGRELGDPVGRFTTRRWLLAWFHRHPEFVGSHYLGRKPKLGCIGSNPAAEGVGTRGEQFHPHDLQRPSPAG